MKMGKMILISTLSVIATACSNPKKQTLQRDIPTKATAQGQDAANDKSITNQKIRALVSSKNCLPLDQLASTLSSDGDNPISVYVRNLDLITAANKSWDGDQQTRERVLLAEPKPKLIESMRAADINTSTIIGTLLKVDSQTNCEKVVIDSKPFYFIDNSKGEKPAVTADTSANINMPQIKNNNSSVAKNSTVNRVNRPSTPSSTKYSVTVKASDDSEQRTYSISGDKLDILIEKPASAITNCKNEPVSDLRRRTHIVINFGATTNQKPIAYTLNPLFNNLLKSSVPVASGLPLAATNNDGTLPKSSGSKGIGVTNVDPSLLVTISNALTAGQIKSFECPKQ